MKQQADNHDWRRYLHTLPEAEAPEALWSRIAQARAANTPRRSSGRWVAGTALAASVALAAVLVLRQTPEATVVPAVATLAAPIAADHEALRALDDAIALAYARNAGEEELASLWQTRERLLGSPADSEPLLARL